MDEHIQAIILAVVERAPQWVRRDLEAKDIGVRARAEETLAAMITAALKGEAVPATQTAAATPD
ncbi:DUF6771 family protein [Sphingobium scionense]|uniref:Uncharacterized protein n=2 Tax=Sphingobium TaxID=165695 RepID=A0AA42X0N7_SPHYA|nr:MULTISPECIES: DUF6771 family protein [Sphingobium]MBB4148077.1 hypothetical protein [Sphingobium scionense]MDH2133622.1 hypothetical protein [Sphingobium yanoikuyae]MDH2151558.1 hypothetical protein [Sphingobium yanoikuyae]MDH2168937.1 hypothetical protein [Sphingobium yanoikuyae]